jgi:hypothetical protein
MTLIDQAQSEMIIVSPYNKISNWKKLVNRIERAKQRGVEITWYIRKDTENNAQYVRNLGIEPIEIENMHCKLYLNEKHAVVTSMNLHEFSDNSSIDIGYYVTQHDKYLELKDFIKIYLSAPSIPPKSKAPILIEEKSFFTLLEKRLQELPLENIIIKVHKRTTLIVENFIYKGMLLIFEPRGDYFRIDFRINQHYNISNEIFNLLHSRSNALQHGFEKELSFGNQMNRLKFDLQIFDERDYERWSKKELDILWPHVLNIIQTLKNELDKEEYAQMIRTEN